MEYTKTYLSVPVLERQMVVDRKVDVQEFVGWVRAVDQHRIYNKMCERILVGLIHTQTSVPTAHQYLRFSRSIFRRAILEADADEPVVLAGDLCRAWGIFAERWSAFLHIFRIGLNKRMRRKQEKLKKKFRKANPKAVQKPGNNAKVRHNPIKGVRLTNAEYRRLCLGAFDTRSIACQAGKKLSCGTVKVVDAPVTFFESDKRAVRDQIQRESAKKKVKAAYKAIPKPLREKNILLQRDKRTVTLAEPQGGKLLYSIGGAATGLVLTKVVSLFSKANKALDSTNDIFKTLQSLKTNLQSTVKGLLWSVPFVMAIYYITHHVAELSPFVSAAIGVAAVRLIPGALWKVISPMMNDKAIRPQSTCGVMSKLLATVFTFSIFKGKMSPSKITEFVKRISMLERASTGWESFMKWVMSALEAMVNCVREKLGKERVEMFKSAQRPVDDWTRKCDKAILALNICEKDDGHDTIQELLDLLREGHTLKEFFRGTPAARGIDEYMARLYSQLLPYTGALNAKNNFRIEPECAILSGKPGIGKTLMTLFICASVMKLSGLLPPDCAADDVTANIWQKGSGKYWNSYAGQHCFVLDDAWQRRGDPTDPENDCMTIIRAKSSWAFPLEFADVASKGKNFFSSKFILGTCNVTSIDSIAALSVYEPRAVTRRIDHGYVIQLKPQYATAEGRLDHLKFEQEKARCSETQRGIDAFPWHIWTAHKNDFITGETHVIGVPLKEVVVDIANRLRYKIASHGNMQSDLNRFINGLEAINPAEIVPQAGRNLSPNELPVLRPPGGNTREELSRLRMELNTAVRRAAGDAQREHFSWKRTICASIVGALVGLGVCLALSLVAQALRFMLSSMASACGFVLEKIGVGKKKEKGVPRVQSNRPLTKPLASSPTEMKMQGGNVDVVNNAYASTYKLVVMSERPNVVGQIMFVNDRLAVQPEHFFSEILNDGIPLDTILRFTNCNQGKHYFDITLEKYMSFKRFSDSEADVDFILFEDVRSHKNLENNFLTENQLKYIPTGRARLDICVADKDGALLDTFYRNTITLPSMRYGRALAYSGRFLKRFFEYDAPTDFGDCGAPVALFDNSSYSGRTIFGIHAAGNSRYGVGMCAIITQEMIIAARKALCTIDDKFLDDLKDRGVVMQAGRELPYKYHGSFLPIGKLEKSIVLCPRTSYYPTLLYGAFGEYNCSPAPLSPVVRDGEVVYPMGNAVLPYSSPMLIYDTSKMSHIAHVAFAPLTKLIRNEGEKMIFSFEESIKGIPEMKFRSIPRKTAAGFPYCYHVSSGKVEFFGDADEYDLTTPMAVELRARVEHIESMAKRGERSAVLFNDFLKDEIRSEKKVQAVATRLISSAPLDYVILWRMYFGDFSARVMSSHTLSGMAPGICVYTDWERLATKLQSKGLKVFAGDFKAFDSSEQPCLMRIILNYINSWYDDGEENRRVREVLWCDLCHSRHVGGLGSDQRYVYQWNKSLPSGHPFTTILNSMYSLLLLVACYVELTGDLVGFWNTCYAVTYGDDNVVNIDDSIAHVYNQSTVAGAMKDMFGMTYTSDDKEGELITYTDLSGVSFLKRRFYYEKYYCNCPLELDSFLFCVYWCKNKRLETKIRQDELENALEELSLHPPTVWDTHAKKVYDLLSKYKVPNAPFEREAYLRIVRNRADSWY